ncbi:hypothetical protein PAXRUDRAFT_36724 [Paxillus rubicundulus Ve08.2h10]|uniref:Uncharacterized protein n=1 Tax=Paxillus rubicundulus Ve08.2h10 TaxID=930991 RepID=A0A0D0CRG7_9AGAM|nr:hypothetical protein PAXRUDRAFT_36724 [Paxillus rubicundulus Ve08.2h10]
MSSDTESQVLSPTDSDSPASTPLGLPGKQKAPKQIKCHLKATSPPLLHSHSKPYLHCKSNKHAPSAAKIASELLWSHCSCEVDKAKISDIMSNGLEGISQETFCLAVLAKEVSCETKCQLLATAWEIEETKWYAVFLEQVQKEQQHELDTASESLHFFESLVAKQSLPCYHQERKELFAAYDKELGTLSLVDKELDGSESELDGTLAAMYDHSTHMYWQFEQRRNLILHET